MAYSTPVIFGSVSANVVTMAGGNRYGGNVSGCTCMGRQSSSSRGAWFSKNWISKKLGGEI